MFLLHLSSSLHTYFYDAEVQTLNLSLLGRLRVIKFPDNETDDVMKDGKKRDYEISLVFK
jgi:hypothetical protein